MSMNDFINMLSPEQKQALLNALTSNTPTLNNVPEEVKKESIQHIQASEPSTAKAPEDFTMNRQASNTRRKEPVKARKNEFVDDGEYARDVETPKYERSPRRREAPKKVDLECHVCGRTFKTDQRFVYGEYYRCNRCTGK